MQREPAACIAKRGSGTRLGIESVIQLWHVSEQPDIGRFSPRLPTNTDAGVTEPVVWAVADTHLANYLLPRDCPRICLRASAATSEADRDRFLGSAQASAVIIIEEEWRERSANTTLWLYALPAATFRCADANAGYHVSTTSVVPISVTRIAAPLDLLRQSGAELRIVQRLRPLAADVARSTLAFSIIRLRNAATVV